MSVADLVADLAHRLRSAYVLPERGAAAADLLTARLAAGAYGAAVDPALCAALTADLAAACADRHLRLTWRRTPADPATAAADARARYREQLAARGYGVARADRAPDGTATVVLTDVGPAGWVGGALAAAFDAVAGARALLLDLRDNPGGTPDGAALVCSYLLPPPPVVVNRVHHPHGEVREYRTAATLPAARFAGPAWVLTSARTFSGAEEVAYNLQALRRATVVGERTRGGAHPTAPHWLTPHVVLHLPYARSVNPVTGTNWEGVGVTPDVPVPAAGAEAAARALAAAAG
ncbi:interphotoreceptor retinoid-binding protein [Pilimelia terevasa]|uniref:Interphotoreceptor retinoid-binding protein n=1 Tax=Pilimelia terevasa TaxID=53372 RepID=A0A8J3BL21_9ACTN|nr:S41 family peptidase [Pilimelia terevasa]GGK26992.1 interphotoreceptor retinoid-binding protein [Pilimelia terevasa]